MGRESSFWKGMRGKLSVYGHFERVETLVNVGTPDVNFALQSGTEGWIELKCLAKWPPLLNVVKINHFSPEQRIWLMKRGMAGGNAFVFLKIEATRDYLLFNWDWAAKFLGRVRQPALWEAAIFARSGSFEAEPFVESLNRFRGGRLLDDTRPGRV